MTSQGAKELTRYAEGLASSLQRLESPDLPVIAYYGAGRLWRLHNQRDSQTLTHSPAIGYKDCLSSRSSFTQVQQWMGQAHGALKQAKLPPGNQLHAQVEAVFAAINAALEPVGYRDAHYSEAFGELAMWPPEAQDSGPLPMRMLSDGLRAMVSLSADIAFRAARLNEHLGAQAAALSTGVVLIDEIDLHLHPRWQQRVIRSLQEAFPRLQLIITTHSPQVLSSAHRDSIIMLDPEVAAPPLTQTYGATSQDILQGVMGVDLLHPRTQ
jgi:predicted ATP-binding protein involved in virulence